MKLYAGIGSRSTPPEMCSVMTNIAEQLAKDGWTLRSGHADGADKAFEAGAGAKEIYLPWNHFNGSKGQDSHIVPNLVPEMEQIARRYHPNWLACSTAAKLMHMRNVCQVLGTDCKTPVKMVICWTPNGLVTGGTGQALRMAKGLNIPVFNIALERHQIALMAFLDQPS